MIFSNLTARIAPLLRYSVGIAALGVVGLCAPSAHATVYSIDDGSAEGAVGLGPTDIGDAIFLNEFTALPGDKTITSISIEFGNPGSTGGVINGLPITILLYSDPNNDGDPSDASLLTLSAGVISSANSNTFVTFPITPTTVPTTDFFVGFELQNEPANTFVAGLDQTAPTFANRSFITFGDAGTINPVNLSANQFPPRTIETYGINGNFLIRANTAVPEPSTWAGVLGGLGLLAGAQRFRRERAA